MKNRPETEIKKESGHYADYIKEMKHFENNLTFFTQLLDKALKTPNADILSELEKHTEQLPFTNKTKP